MKMYHRVRSVRSVSITTPDGKMHLLNTRVMAPTGEMRLVTEREDLFPYLHPADWSSKPADVIRTYDEEQGVLEQAEREKRLTPDIAEVVARVTAAMNAERLQGKNTEDLILAAVRAELAAQAALPAPAEPEAEPVQGIEAEPVLA